MLGMSYKEIGRSLKISQETARKACRYKEYEKRLYDASHIFHLRHLSFIIKTVHLHKAGIHDL